MALHQSLLDLAELARQCSSPAHARGLLAEAQDLTRNALAHREDELALTPWFSRLISDIVRSPGITNELGQVRLTGDVALGDATPASEIAWLGQAEGMRELFTSAGFIASPVEETTATRVDAGLPVGVGGEEALLKEALALRPPTLQLVNGLPDPNQQVNLRAHLLDPIQALARWVAPAPRPTTDRLAIGRERELLTHAEHELLTLAWGTGIALTMSNWLSHVDRDELSFSELAPLDRTAYGAACRMVGEVFDSLIARQS